MEIKPTGLKGFSRVYDDENNEIMSLAFIPPEEKVMTAKEMFKELGFKIDDIKKTYLSYYNKEEDSYIYFDYIYKTVEVQFDINMDLLKAINKQVEELGWDND